MSPTRMHSGVSTSPTPLLLKAVQYTNGVPYCNPHLQEETANEKKTINFLKLSAPWEVLVFHAEEMCIRAPLQV